MQVLYLVLFVLCFAAMQFILCVYMPKSKK
jgi:hypothetical protein